MKGIILAGGKGTRLYPSTLGVNKQLLPVFDKPMIYYPLAILMMAGIKDILVISTPRDISIYQLVLGDGSHVGLSVSYEVEGRPEGIAKALIIGADFMGTDNVCLVLGDNLMYGEGLSIILRQAAQLVDGALIFGYWTENPQRFGVVEFNSAGTALGIEEKPQNPKSNYAVPGVYFYDNQVKYLVKTLKPSPRGELEITDVNRIYLKNGKLKVKILKKGIAWLDTGTPESLLDAANFVAMTEKRQAVKIACIEEIALDRGFIDLAQFNKLLKIVPMGSYRDYLCSCLKRKE